MYKIPEDLKSKYEFVSVAAARAEQLQSGAVPRAEWTTKKLTVIAQHEVAVGAVEPVDPDAEPLDAEVAEEVEVDEE